MNAAQNDTPVGVPGDPQENTSTDVETSLGPKSGDATGEAGGNDETRAPEQESQSQIPGDPREPNQNQPPTKEQY